MALTDFFIPRLAGTFRAAFRLADVILKREDASTLGVRNSTDTGYINVRVASPLDDNDAATKLFVTNAVAGGGGGGGGGGLTFADVAIIQSLRV